MFCNQFSVGFSYFLGQIQIQGYVLSKCALPFDIQTQINIWNDNQRKQINKRVKRYSNLSETWDATCPNICHMSETGIFFQEFCHMLSVVNLTILMNEHSDGVQSARFLRVIKGHV